MTFLYIICSIAVIVLIIYLKRIIIDKPRDEIQRLKNELSTSEKRHLAELSAVHTECKNQIDSITSDNNHLQAEYDKIYSALKTFESNITAIPYMAGMIADIETYGLEKLALGLSWGNSQRRLDKVKSIREIRRDARAMVEKNKEAQYQLGYLLELFPNLSDIIDCEFNQLPAIEVRELSEYDSVHDYLSRDEYLSLSVTQRNQLALDRYINSHNKTKWQIGRDYELYIGYQYRRKGYEVDNYGSYMGLEDLGRDIIAKKGESILIIQCKYWSSAKQIHEKHIMQLYGTIVSYCIENAVDQSHVTGVLITNTQLSETAKKTAEYLGVEFIENYAMGLYPCIKCNIGHNELGETKIYHLPFDQQYDATKIKKYGEFYAMTVREAEAAGFRRTFKWFGNK